MRLDHDHTRFRPVIVDLGDDPAGTSAREHVPDPHIGRLTAHAERRGVRREAKNRDPFSRHDTPLFRSPLTRWLVLKAVRAEEGAMSLVTPYRRPAQLARQDTKRDVYLARTRGDDREPRSCE